MRYIVVVFVLVTSTFAQFGIQLGAYSQRPTIPAAVRNANLPVQIVQEQGLFKLIVGPYASETQAQQVRNQYGLQGSLRQLQAQNAPASTAPSSGTLNFNTPTATQQNFNTPAPSTTQDAAYAVEILSTKDTRSIPKRIIAQVFSFGITPVYVFDQGLYRLVVGPLSAAQANTVARQLTNGFGRSIYPLSLPRGRFNAAISVQPPTQQELSQEALAVKSSDNNEHISFLEQERQKAARKYYTQPYGQTTADNNALSALPEGAAPTATLPQNTPQLPADLINAPAVLGFDAITRQTSGQFVSAGVASSKNLFAINGVVIASQFLRSFRVGYKFNDNTLVFLGYLLPERKVTLVNLAQNQQATISSTYDLMFDADMIYRYFLPSFRFIFLQANFGVSTVRQSVVSQVPLNFGSSYSYQASYLQPKIGLGVGFKALTSFSGSVGINTHFTLKSVSTSTEFYVNYEF